ncbi:hypothetical protein Baya_8292 [Bagarius yarrelli]|uniref:Uncharacterized protein n=1 Tax=Bagarius yarrelli TaxID=175774 RepID=A0A556U3S2_BAGYA|nr:hypothetical protein Baya_8292 [Bagarius yarrelli]
MEPAKPETSLKALHKLVKALHGALQNITDPTAFCPSAASSAAVTLAPMVVPFTVFSVSAVVNPTLYAGMAEDCSGFLLQCLLAIQMQV